MTTTQQMEIQASHLLKCERVSTLGLRTCCADRKNMIQEAKSHRRRRICMDFACNGSARLNCYGGMQYARGNSCILFFLVIIYFETQNNCREIEKD